MPSASNSKPVARTASDKQFVEAVHKWRTDSVPVAWKSGKVIHQFPDLADGYEPLYLHPKVEI